MPDAMSSREGPQAKEPEWVDLWRETGQRGLSPATRGLKKDSDGAITPAVETVHVSALLALPGSPQAKQLCHLHAQHSLGQSCHRQKKSCLYACRVALVLSNSLKVCRLWPARLLCQGAGWFSRQEYWRALASTAFHTLLEHFVSCCPSCQLPLGTWCCQNPCNPSSCITSTPGPHRGKPESSRAALGANPRG